MLKFIIRRLLISVPALLGVTMLVYLFINLAPGDPITVMMSPEQMARAGGEKYVEAMRERLGLNKPIPVRYVLWLRELVQGNWGYSIQFQKPVLERVSERLGATLRLTGAALLLAIALGVPIGMISAIKQYSLLDYFVTVTSYLGVTMPPFFFGMILIYVFGLRLGLLPTSGLQTLGEEPTLRDALAHLAMPAMMLGVGSLAGFARYVRGSMLDVIRQEYLQTARAKGLSEFTVMVRHAFPNALIPVVTIIGLSLPGLFGGAVITETVFAWPGIGRLTVDSIRYRDYPLLMGLTTIFAILVLLSNLLADVAYALVDPRIRYD